MIKRITSLLLCVAVVTSSLRASDTEVSQGGPLDSCMRAGLVVGIMGALGHMIGKQIDQEDIGANLFGVLGMAIDHYLLGGKQDPCSFARIMGYVLMAFARGAYEKKREQQRYVVTTTSVLV